MSRGDLNLLGRTCTDGATSTDATASDASDAGGRHIPSLNDLLLDEGANGDAGGLQRRRVGVLFIGLFALRVLFQESAVQSHVAVERRRVLETTLTHVAFHRATAVRRTVTRRVASDATASDATASDATAPDAAAAPRCRPFHFAGFFRFGRHLIELKDSFSVVFNSIRLDV